MLTIIVSADDDAENALRSTVLQFMDDVRAAEKAIVADLGAITEEQWRAAWPAEVPDELMLEELEPVRPATHPNRDEPQ